MASTLEMTYHAGLPAFAGAVSGGMSADGPPPGERSSYRVSDDPLEVEREQRRLALLGDLRDRTSARTIERCGIRPGWRCLDVGSGGGSLARWMADRVGPSGSVLATDVDVRFQRPGQGNLEVRRHDIVREPLPEDEFDLVHARAVLQVLEQRESVLDALVRAAKPGGWLLVSDPDWSAFECQPLPPDFRALYEAMTDVAERLQGYDRTWGGRLLAAFHARGLEEIDCRGQVATMRGGTGSAEWLILAYERAAPALVRAGLVDPDVVERGLRTARRDDFLAMSPLSVTCRGRKPGRSDTP